MTQDAKEIQDLVVGGIYRHYKGHSYKVINIAKHSEDLSQYVVYQALYGDFGVWVRPLDMFLEKIELNGEEVARFEFLSYKS
jgi:hypothetical protein